MGLIISPSNKLAPVIKALMVAISREKYKA